MLLSCRGLVFRKIAYSDKATILHIYTREEGMKTFMVRNRGKRLSGQKAMFMPLSILEVVASHGKSDILNVKEIKIATPTPSVYSDLHKSSIVMFLNEVLVKTIIEHERNTDLYDYIENAILALDHIEEGLRNFHLLFLARLTYFLGFMPSTDHSSKHRYFNLYEGLFSEDIPMHEMYLDQDMSILFNNLLKGSFGELSKIEMNNDQRRQMILALLKFYELHVENFKDIKSHEVLETVLQ